MTEPDLPRERLEALYVEFQKSLPPRGAGVSCQDAQIDIDEYDGHVSGLVQSYLAGLEIDPASVNLGDESAAMLAACADRIAELRTHLDLQRALAHQLVECLTSAPGQRFEPQ